MNKATLTKLSILLSTRPLSTVRHESIELQSPLGFDRFNPSGIPVLKLLAAAALLPALAIADSGTAIPARVKDQLLKRHPQAAEIQASPESHFGNHLLKVSFKENDEINMELFRANGALYSNVLPVDDPTPLPSALLNTLKSEFTGYQFKKAELVVNPNGVGEEYGVYLLVDNANWLVWVNDKGQVLNKSNY